MPGNQTLISIHDDATSRLLMARFVARDNGAENRRAIIEHLGRHGCPVAVYTDHAGHSGQWLSKREERTGTIISRGLGELGVEVILAGSPQAKGRVERSFGTGQDRLVKEMRVEGSRRSRRPTASWGTTGYRSGTSASPSSTPTPAIVVVDVLGAVVRVEGPDLEREGGEEVFEDGEHEDLGDAGDGADVLELGDLVDDVEDVKALLAVEVALVDGVDTDEAGAALGIGSAADADGYLDGAGLVEGAGPQAVVAPLAEVVDVAVGDVREAFEPLVAVDLVLSAEDPLGGGSGEAAVGGVDLGQEGGVPGREAPLEGVGRRLLAAVADAVGPPVLGDQPGELRS